MTDVLTRTQRSRNMAAIKSKDTKPEIAVRQLLHRIGYRYVLHDGRLPGRPDLVFPGRRKIILVHGCFWHMHRCRYGKVVPATNAGFWHEKRTRNVARDRATVKALANEGWRVLITWECQVRNLPSLRDRLVAFLDL
jgi:DNA mismatch endonuclease, patch repair protein